MIQKTIAKPFVKWVGGKTQLLDEVEKSLPKDLHRYEELTYIEPFVGGGAVLFWILQKYPNIKRAVINDINPDLICTYKVIKCDVQRLVDKLDSIQTEYISLSPDGRKEYFLQKRKEYNTKGYSDLENAALFIFLNRTCFNGLYRVNKQGKFNVPFGKYKNPKICDEEGLRAASDILKKLDLDFSDLKTN